MDKEAKRYQECNWLVKLWRRRWYLAIPFQWLWHTCLSPMKVIPTDEGDEVWELNGKQLWKVLIGSAQIKMNWWYTMEEVFDEHDIIQEEECNI
jgi:hypothetical protein